MNQRKVELLAGSTVAAAKVYNGSIDCAVQVSLNFMLSFFWKLKN